MKKSIFLFCLLLIGTASFAQTDKKKTLVATYEGFDGSIYAFVDEQEEYHLFDALDPAAKKQYNLDSEEFNYEVFKVIYTESTNEDGDVFLKIVGLEIQSTEED